MPAVSEIPWFDAAHRGRITLGTARFLDSATNELVISRDRRESRNLAGRELEIPPLRFAPVGMTTGLGEGEEFLGL